MLARYFAGESSTALAAAYFVNRATIINYVRRKGLEPKKPGIAKRATLELGKKAQQMREQGLAWKVICRQLNMSRTALSTAANEYKDHRDVSLLSQVQ